MMFLKLMRLSSLERERKWLLNAKLYEKVDRNEIFKVKSNEIGLNYRC
jgi:hypothetical protein